MDERDREDLRERAEHIRANLLHRKDMTNVDVNGLIEELQTHGIELEIQNEDLRDARQHAEESTSRYRELFAICPLPLILLHPDSTVVEANTAAVTLLDATFGAFPGGNRLLVYLHHRSRAAFMAHIGAAAEGNLPAPVVVRIRGRAQFRTVEARSISFSLDDHRDLVLTALEDVTERNETLRALEEERKAYETLATNSPDIIVRLDRHGSVVYASPGFERATGLAAATVRKKHPKELTLPPDFADAWTAAVERSRKSRMNETVETSLPHGTIPELRDGTYIRLTVVPEIDHGRIQSFLSIGTDITPHRVLEEQLEQERKKADSANRAKSEFLSHVSHEIRTPMNSLLGFAQLLAMDELPDTAKAKLEMIASSGRQLLRIVNDLLDLSKIEGGRFEVELSTYSPADLVYDVVEESRSAADAAGLRISARVDDNVPKTAVSDEGRLRQVLDNLVSNALKYTEFGEIEVGVNLDDTAGATSAHEAAALEFWVRDTGPGIAEEDQERIFEGFVRGKPPGIRQTEGFGLGLAICRRVAELLGGTIHLHSRRGCGSVFSVIVPLATTDHGAEGPRASGDSNTPSTLGGRHDGARNRRRGRTDSDGTGLKSRRKAAEAGSDVPRDDESLPGVDAARRRSAPADGAPAHGTPSGGASARRTPAHGAHRVLIAEDNEANRLVIEAFVSRLGAVPLLAPDGEEAIELLKSNWADIALLDIQMAPVDGSETMRMIRDGAAGERNKDLPILAVTAYAMADDVKRLVREGFDGHIAKPIEVADIEEHFSRLKPRVERRRKAAGQFDATAGSQELPLSHADARGQFMEQTEGMVEELRKLRERAQFGPAGKIAHSIANIAWAVGARKLLDEAKRVDSAARTGELESASNLLDSLIVRLERERSNEA